jgi:hypothetical protein
MSENLPKLCLYFFLSKSFEIFLYLPDEKFFQYGCLTIVTQKSSNCVRNWKNVENFFDTIEKLERLTFGQNYATLEIPKKFQIPVTTIVRKHYRKASFPREWISLTKKQENCLKLIFNWSRSFCKACSRETRL